MDLVLTVALAILLLWGVGLAASSLFLINKATSYRGSCRDEDLFQLFALLCFDCAVLAILTCAPSMVYKYQSTFMVLLIPTAFAFVHLAQRQYFNIKALKISTQAP